MNLSTFISSHIDDILAHWDAFASTQQPAAAEMSSMQLRNHARQMLEAIARDLEADQTPEQQDEKSKGAFMGRRGAHLTAASTHGAERQGSGFTLLQLTAEYRAVRASVLRLWRASHAPADSSLDDVIRFNEAIDQALAESIVQYDEQARRTRDTFLAVLGHDLRTPLSSVASAGQFLSGPTPKPVEIGLAGARIKRNAASMTALTNDLLEYARTQLGGTLQMSPQDVDLRAVAQAALHDASASHPDCAYDLEATGDLHGHFDGERIQQLLTNLLSNAAQYRDKHYRVTLELAGDAEDIVLRVKNRGPAIPKSHLEAVFNPMVQLALQLDQERPAASLGLGLFVAREISRAHKGSISATSTEKDGTVFTVRLPRDALRPASEVQPAPVAGVPAA